MLDRQRQDSAPEVEPFRQAAGGAEFPTDATQVNTLDGWRDLKLGVCATRPGGPPAPAEHGDQRSVPAPTARCAVAASEASEGFAPRWRSWAAALGLAEQPGRVLGDGAEWIWPHAAAQFTDWRGTLDLSHAGEWLAKAAKAGCGDGTDEAACGLRESRLALLRDGYRGLCAYLHASGDWVPKRAGREGMAPEVLNYFCGHPDRLNDAARRRRGQPRGSGLIEGACKQRIGRRRKQTGAQWTVVKAKRRAVLCAIADADAFPLYFTAA